MRGYWKKYKEAEYNLSQLKICFAKKDTSFEHYLNNFLSSAQSVFWIINKEFSQKEGYKDWQEKRKERLPEKASIFKELRNVSLKEEPLEHEGIINNFDFGATGITIPPHAKITMPWIDIKTGNLQSNKAQIETVTGEIYEVEPLIIHDFSVNITSDSKSFKIDTFLNDADHYISSIKNEIIEAEAKFK